MLTPQINQPHSLRNLVPLHKPFVSHGATNHCYSTSSPAFLRQHMSAKKSDAARSRSTSTLANIKAIATPYLTKTSIITGVITIQPPINSALANLSVDGIADLRAGSFLLELVSNDFDVKGNQKTVQANATYDALDFHLNMYTYKCTFNVPVDFGEIGAVLVQNEYSNKMFFKTIALDNNVTFTCESWVQSKNNVPDKRIFFTDKVNTMPEKLVGLDRVGFDNGSEWGG